MKIKFKKWNCELKKAKYGNQRTALVLEDPETDEPIATATVNLSDHTLATSEVAIKDYSENAGMLQALQAAGVVGKPLRYVRSGFAAIPVCKILKEPQP